MTPTEVSRLVRDYSPIRVAHDTVGDLHVSTLGFYGARGHIVWETLVCPIGDVVREWAWENEEDAQVGHGRVVAQLREEQQ